MEWYRLALSHCPHNFSLHDDFYLDDGTADQPKEAVIDAALFPAPTLKDKSANLNDLWEFTLTRYALGETIYDAWRLHPPLSVLELLTQRYEERPESHCRSTALELGSNCLGPLAADLVRRAWLDYPEGMYFGALANASVACLPSNEGFTRCLRVFQELPLKEQRPRMMYMAKFKNPGMLDWIEAHIQPPITDHWGGLAARSGISWERVIKWLQSGRPMSLVALDAMNGVAFHAEEGRLEMHVPIDGLPSRDVVEQCLRAFESTDPAPRVQYSINCILDRYHLLVPQSQSA